MTMLSSVLLPIFLVLPAPLKVGLIMFGVLNFGTAVKAEDEQVENNVRALQEEQSMVDKQAQRLAQQEQELAKRQIAENIIVIVLNDEGTYFFDGKKNQTAEQLSDALLLAGKAEPQRKVYIHSKKNHTHKDVLKVLSLCKDSGLEKISFVSSPDATKQ